MRETWVQSLGWEDPLEKGTATHSGIPAWRIPWTVQSTGSQSVGHDWATCTKYLIPVKGKSRCTARCLTEVFLQPCSLKCGPQTHSCITGSFPNTTSWVPPKTPWIRICLITRSRGDLCTVKLDKHSYNQYVAWGCNGMWDGGQYEAMAMWLIEVCREAFRALSGQRLLTLTGGKLTYTSSLGTLSRYFFTLFPV